MGTASSKPKTPDPIVYGNEGGGLGFLKWFQCGSIDVPTVCHPTGDEPIVHICECLGCRGGGNLIV